MPLGYGIGYGPSLWSGGLGQFVVSNGLSGTSNGSVPAGDQTPYNGTEAPGYKWAPPTLPAPRFIGPLPGFTVPQDATQTAEQLNGGRKQIKLPEAGVIIALAAAVLLLPALLK